jgi:hypothetical protein
MLQAVNQLLSFGFEPAYEGEITFGVSIGHGLSSSASQEPAMPGPGDCVSCRQGLYATW